MGRHPHVSRWKSPAGSDFAMAEYATESTQVLHLAKRIYATLSGGEQRRVSLARVLAQDSPVVLPDAPASAMDIGHQQLVTSLSDVFNQPVMVVPHPQTGAPVVLAAFEEESACTPAWGSPAAESEDPEIEHRRRRTMSVVKINAITPAPGGELELEARFGARAREVEHMEGFEGFQLLRPVSGDDRYYVYTRWRSEEDFQRWVNSAEFRRGHAKTDGEKPVATHATLLSFEVVEWPSAVAATEAAR